MSVRHVSLSGHRLSAALFVTLGLAGTALADSWPMKHRDMQKTGRASFTVPASRLNNTFFDVIRWQKQSPGSPGEGNLDVSSMTFFDGVGPGGKDVVVSGYHWPKGVQGMDRHTGKRLWYGSLPGGEGIGSVTPAFSPNGSVVYVGTDGTTPTMAFLATTGPSAYWSYTGGLLAGGSPVMAPDGRIFRFGWADRIYGGTDTGSAINLTWSAATANSPCYSDPTLYQYATGDLRVICVGRSPYVKSYRADNPGGTEAWSVTTNSGTDANATVDPANGKIYYAHALDGDVWVVGVSRDGAPLWGSNPWLRVYDAGANNAQGITGAGCLSHDGATYYFETYSNVGDGQLYAINTASGTVKWTYNTQSKGSGEGYRSWPMVTPNGVIVVGNNDNMQYFAIQDTGTAGTVLDTLTVEPNSWNTGAVATASLSADGLLYLPTRLVWIASNGDGDGPSFQAENLYNAFDLNDGAVMNLPPPPHQGGIALNHAVKIYWKPILDPTGVFDHYAIYRKTSAFTDVTGLTPIATVTGLSSTTYTDSTAVNGTHYYYAVTSVATGGGEIKTVTCHGPRTPYVRTDLQVTSLARTPRYPRYQPNYTWWWATEPSGFGPYLTSAATSLGGGQTPETQRWPEIDDPVTYVATVRNNGTNQWFANTTGVWKRNGVVVATQQQVLSLQPYDTATYTYTDTWTDALYPIQFTLSVSDAKSYNNTRTTWTKSAPFLTYCDVGFMENFREISTPMYPQAATDNAIDWLQRHADKMNSMFVTAGSSKRVHYDVLQTLQDGDDLPGLELAPFGIFPLRYDADTVNGNTRGSGYYSAPEDIDYGMCHEMSHQLGLIDIYVFNFGGEANRVSSLPYSPPADLMLGCSPLYSPASAGAMTSWVSIVHGYYGQYMYDIPAQVQLRVLDFNGQPLPGATVKMYQLCNHPDGEYISDQIKAQGVTDASGIWTLPNVPIDPELVPPTDAGVLHDNPFGYVAVVGWNAVLHFKIEYGEFADYAWLSLPDVNLAYWAGQTDMATFDRQTTIGGPRQNFPPADMAEMNVENWTGYAQDATYTLANDTSRKHNGAGSICFDTTGGFETYVQYPVGLLGRWDLTSVDYIRFWAYVVNDQTFQNASPWVRLGNHLDGYFQWTPNSDVLNSAINQWHEFVIPVSGDATWTRSTFGNPTLSRINYIQLLADTWDWGFTLWYDGVRFDPSPQPHRGDTNCDGVVNFDDINAFVTALVSEEAYYANYPNCALENADCNGDGAVDFDDINPFVTLLVQ